MSKRKKIFHKPEDKVPSAEDILNYLNDESAPETPASRNVAPSPKGGSAELEKSRKKKSERESFSEEESLSSEREKKDSESVIPSLSLSMDTDVKPEKLVEVGEKERKKNKKKHTLEKSMLSEPLVSDAVEGYALISDRKRAGALVEEINRKIAAQTEKKENRRAVYSRIAAILVLVFLLAGGSLVLFDQWSEVQLSTMSRKEATPFADTVSAMDNTTTQSNSLALDADEIPAQDKRAPLNGNAIVQSDGFVHREQAKDKRISEEAESKIETLPDKDDLLGNTLSAPEKKEENKTISPAATNTYQWAVADSVEVLQEARNEVIIYNRKKDKGESRKEKIRAKESSSDKQSSDLFSPKVADAEEKNTSYKAKKGYLLEDGIRLYNEGNYAEAKEIFSGVLVAQPSNQEATFYRGMAAYKLNQFEPALSDLSKIIAASKRYDEARWTRSLIYEQTGRKEEAVALWKTLSQTSNSYSEQSFRKLKEYTK